MSNLVDLRVMAKQLNVKGYSVLKKADLIAAIEKQHPVPVPVSNVEAKSSVEVKPEKPKVKSEKIKEPKEKGPRKANEWNTFLGDYRAKNNLSLKQAMSQAKEEYVKQKGSTAESKSTTESPKASEEIK